MRKIAKVALITKASSIDSRIETILDVQARINNAIEQGWEISGELIVSTTVQNCTICQRMVKYEEEIAFIEQTVEGVKITYKTDREMYERNVVEALLEELNENFGDLGMSDIQFKEYIKAKLG